MKFVKPNQLDSRRPGTWPVYYRVLLWIVAVALVTFLYNQFMYEDLMSKQRQNQSQLDELKQKYKTLYQYSADLELYGQRKEELAKKLVSLLKFLPAETEMPSLIEEVYKASYKSNINFTDFKPQNRISGTYYDIEPISLTASTGFNNFTGFIQYIGELPRILNVRQFNLSVDQNTPESIDISGSLETYIYNQDIGQFINSERKVDK